MAKPFGDERLITLAHQIVPLRFRYFLHGSWAAFPGRWPFVTFRRGNHSQATGPLPRTMRKAARMKPTFRRP